MGWWTGLAKGTGRDSSSGTSAPLGHSRCQQLPTSQLWDTNRFASTCPFPLRPHCSNKYVFCVVLHLFRVCKQNGYNMRFTWFSRQVFKRNEFGEAFLLISNVENSSMYVMYRAEIFFIVAFSTFCVLPHVSSRSRRRYRFNRI